MHLRRELREAVVFLRDQLDVYFYSLKIDSREVTARRIADQVLELLLELGAIDLVGVAELLRRGRAGRSAFRRRMRRK